MQPLWKPILITSLFALALLISGITHLIYADKLSQFYRRVAGDEYLKNPSLLRSIWIEGSRSAPVLRMGGIIFIAAGLLLIAVMIRGLLDPLRRRSRSHRSCLANGV